MQLMLNTVFAAARHARRLVVLVVGFTVLAFGIALIVLPGPAFVVIPMGLGILSMEFVWARVWLQKLRASAEATATRIRSLGTADTQPASSAGKSD